MGLYADLRYAFRNLRLAPGFHTLLVGTLALGIGVSTSVFSIVDGVLLRPLPYHDPGRLVSLTSVSPDPKFDSNGSISYYDFEELKAHAQSFQDLAITYRTGWSIVTLTGDEPERIQGAFVSSNLFELVGRAPMIGHVFTADDDRRGDRVVVASEALALQRYGSATEALGRDLEIAGARWRIIGVMPDDVRVPFLTTRAWMPIHSHPEWNTLDDGQDPRFAQRWDVVARLKPGVRVATAQAEVDSIEAQLRSAKPDTHEYNVRVIPLREHFTGAVSRQIWILFGSVAFLISIACFNAGNLLLSRAAARRHEFAVRAALGGGRGQLLRQLLCESVAFCVIAGAVGAALSGALIPFLKAVAPEGIPRLDGVVLNSRVLAFAIAISMLTGVLVGVVPALSLSRASAGTALASSGRSVSASRDTRRVKSALVAAEFAMTMVLLTGAGLLIRSFVAVLNVDPGFLPENVLTVALGLPNSTPGAQLRDFYSEVMQSTSALPGVTAVGGVSNLFFLDERRTHALRQVEGRPAEPRSAWTPLAWSRVSGAYFQAMGIPLLRGRYFGTTDRPDSPPVVIINESLARRYWPGEDPIGKRVKGFDPRGRNDDWLTVVGLVRDMHSGGLERAPLAQIYELQSQRGEQMGNIVIRTTGDPMHLASSVRSIVHKANPQAVISSINTMQRVLERQNTPRRFQTGLIGAFSGLALALAAFGVFAVMHYAVTARKREIAIRMAIGARARDVMTLIFGEGARLALAGIAVGAVVSAWATSAIASWLYAVTPGDPLTFCVSALVLAGVAIGACCFPAWRGSRVDPMTALRQD